ncbi:MAG: hypothetical protein V4693_03710 [Pseudomonadota bacterium]
MKRIAMWARLLCASVLYSLAGCAGTPLEQPLRAGSFPLVPQQAVALSASVSVRYDGFTDSRCPPGALCIWAGKVSYNFVLTSKAGAEKFALDYEGDRFDSKLLPEVSFGISFAGVKDRPLDEHAVVLEVAVR